jgi:hypothetical protein
MAIPVKDTLLIAWGSNFDTKVTAAPTTYNLVAAQALAFHTAYTPFVTAYNAVATAREAGSRSKSLTATKDSAKASLLLIGRELYGIVQDSNSVSAADKEDVGVLVRKTSPTPVPPPAEAPGIAIVSTVGNTVKLRLYDVSHPTRRARPRNADGVSVFSFVGATAPSDESGWKFEGVAGTNIVDVVFPSGTAAGAKVWFTAFWFNNRKQSGPATPPVGTNIPGGAAMAA